MWEIKLGVMLAVLFIVSVVFVYINNSHNKDTNDKTSPNVQISASISKQSNSSFSLSDVAKHNTNNDCWYVINNNVYNVTNYLSVHSGGPQILAQYCGKDATTAYNFVKKHGPRANSDLASLLIGILRK